MNYRTGKILLITSLLLLPAAFFPARGEEPAFSYTHIHREGSVSTMETGRVETREKSSKKTTHYDISVNLPSSPAAEACCIPTWQRTAFPAMFTGAGGKVMFMAMVSPLRFGIKRAGGS